MAFTPSRPGIRKSISVTSGRCCFQSSTACWPSPVSASTSMSCSCLIMATNPSRRATARRLRAGGDTLASLLFLVLSISVLRLRAVVILQLDEDFRADSGLGADGELAIHPVNAFLHSAHTETLVLRVRIKTAPVVHEPELNLFRAHVQRRGEVTRARVFDNVGQRLLSDAQESLLVISWNGPRIALRLEIRVQVRAFG